MTSNDSKKSAAPGTATPGAPRPREGFFQRRSVLVVASILALVVGIGVPVVIFSGALSDRCDSGDPLIDAVCLAEKRRLEEIRLGKNKKFNMRPKKEPFRVVENPLGGVPDSEARR